MIICRDCCEIEMSFLTRINRAKNKFFCCFFLASGGVIIGILHIIFGLMLFLFCALVAFMTVVGYYEHENFWKNYNPEEDPFAFFRHFEPYWNELNRKNMIGSSIGTMCGLINIFGGIFFLEGMFYVSFRI